MLLHFYLRFSTKYGQSLWVSGNHDTLGNDDVEQPFALQYLNDQMWHGFIEMEASEAESAIQYKYLLREEDGTWLNEFGNDREIDRETLKAETVVVYDTWDDTGAIENCFYSSAFQNVLLKPKDSTDVSELSPEKVHTHEFKVKAPNLPENEIVCISGSANILNNWDKQNMLPLIKTGNWWTIKLDLIKEIFPIQYKYGTCLKENGKLVKFEEGNNRLLLINNVNNGLTLLHDGFADFRSFKWKGAAVAIPVFSLRSEKGLGTGEFNDIKLLVDWAKETGLRMVQLLPLNDTTSTNSWKDSYPYSAISAFALHPLYINLEAVADSENMQVVESLSAKKTKLNKLAEVDYVTVMQVKLKALKELFQLQKNTITEDLNYFNFFEINRHWLVPYAAFSYLRDKYKTPDFSQWEEFSDYDDHSIQELVSPDRETYDEIAFYYFVQYHLHLQLKIATAYAHTKGIVMKGDIPIGIGRNSVDAWTEPGLYHMNTQAGAPPDAFTMKGQNWGFPTYNWEVMQGDNFTWWRKRFEQMGNYFDAFRIDHILGFFRIWSIPLHAVEGILGRFVPAIPVAIGELFEKNITYSRQRYVKPFMNEEILDEIFGDKKVSVKKTYLNQYQLKDEFNTQRKIEAHFAKQKKPDVAVRSGLYELVSNVILFEEEGTNGQKFHFRILMDETSSFHYLDEHSKKGLKEIYINYFFKRQDDLWRKEALKKLPGLKRKTAMLVCGEDLGMVPECVPEVMTMLGILSLEIQRMPKQPGVEFFHPNDAPYLSVVSPSTHDMSTIRGWWQEDPEQIQRFYNQQMGKQGEAPFYCEPWINKEIILQHLYSPAMWSIFQLQDLLGINGDLRRENPDDERINLPSDPDHYWNYRMHLNIENLLEEKPFNEELQRMVRASGR